ncbi:MAG: hypothetical protein ACI8S6_005738 [Myxococcota bacterium]|jgi:hypothetical protein
MSSSPDAPSARGSLLHGGLSLSSGTLIAVAFFLPAVETCSDQSMAELTTDGVVVLLFFLVAALAAWAAAAASLSRARVQSAALLGQAVTACLALGTILPLWIEPLKDLLSGSSLSGALSTFLYGFWLLMLGTVAAILLGGRGSWVLSRRRLWPMLLVCGLACVGGAGLLFLNVLILDAM